MECNCNDVGDSCANDVARPFQMGKVSLEAVSKLPAKELGNHER